MLTRLPSGLADAAGRRSERAGGAIPRPRTPAPGHRPARPLEDARRRRRPRGRGLRRSGGPRSARQQIEGCSRSTAAPRRRIGGWAWGSGRSELQRRPRAASAGSRPTPRRRSTRDHVRRQRIATAPVHAHPARRHLALASRRCPEPATTATAPQTPTRRTRRTPDGGRTPRSRQPDTSPTWRPSQRRAGSTSGRLPPSATKPRRAVQGETVVETAWYGKLRLARDIGHEGSHGPMDPRERRGRGVFNAPRAAPRIVWQTGVPRCVSRRPEYTAGVRRRCRIGDSCRLACRAATHARARTIALTTSSRPAARRVQAVALAYRSGLMDAD